MSNPTLDIDAYLKRISYQGEIDVSWKTLQNLHIAHAFNVPFENLDIHLGKPISLEPEILFDKIVRQRRGGYCHELNGLFALVLKQIGFAVEYHMARVMYGAKSLRPRTHQLLLVTVEDQQWIADVGFGGHGLIAPLLLKPGRVDHQFLERFQILIDKQYGFVLQYQSRNHWKNLYGFTLETYLPIDYVPVNYMASTSPDSLFTQRKICTMPTSQGRIFLVDRKLKIISAGKTQELEVKNNREYLELLNEYFGIEIYADFS
jgi:N-hydroxyarylamine O-acetyltransferase